jgi:hypothetical protein
MKNRLNISLLLLGIFFSICLSAQTSRTKYYEFGAGIGTFNMQNEIANSSNVNAVLAEIAPSISVFAKYHFNDWFGIGFDVNYANLTSSDANHNNFNRGLSVRTSLLSSNAFTEIHFIRFGKYHLEDKYTVFIKGGLGVAGWNPELSIDGNLDATKYQVESNGYWGLNSFYGLGAKYRLGYNSILTLEFRSGSSGGDTMDGFLEVGDNIITTNDRYWGLLFSYSHAIL